MVARSAAQNCPNRLILPVCTSMSGMCRRYYNIFYRIYIYMSYVYIYVCVLHFHRQLYKALLPLDPDSLMFDVETVRSIDSGVTLPGINCALATYWPIIYPKKTISIPLYNSTHRRLRLPKVPQFRDWFGVSWFQCTFKHVPHSTFRVLNFRDWFGVLCLYCTLKSTLETT